MKIYNDKLTKVYIFVEILYLKSFYFQIFILKIMKFVNNILQIL